MSTLSDTPRAWRSVGRWALAAFGAALAAGLGVAGVVLVLPSGGTGGGPVAETPATEPHRHAVAASREVAVRGGAGRVRLDILSEGTPPSGPLHQAVAAGEPVTLSFTLSGEPPDAPEPTVSALRLDTGSRARVQLARAETVLVSRAGGEVVGAAAPAGSEPGHALTHVTGGSDRWAAKMTPGASTIVGDPARGLLAAAYPGSGTVEVLDLVAQRKGAEITVGGTPSSLAMETGTGRLWVGDTDSGRITVVDTTTGERLGQLAAGEGPHFVVFAPTARRALVVARGSGTASLVDLSRLQVISSVPIAADATAAALGAPAQSFAVAHATGVLTLLRLGGGGLAAPREVRVGSPGEATLAVAPDGRTGAVANRQAGTLAIVNLVTGRLVRTVPAGPEPSGVVFLDRFALAPSARTGVVTWVDAKDPRRSNDLFLGDAPASGVFLAGDEATALAPVPAEKRAYRVHVMMGRPMVMDRVPSAFAADTAVGLAGGLRKVSPGVYELRTALAPGRYRLDIRPAGGGRARIDIAAATVRGSAAQVRPLTTKLSSPVGRAVTVRFRVEGARPATASVIAYSFGARSGALQLRAAARDVGGGVYVATLVPRVAGSYRVSLISEEGGIGPDAGPATVLRATGKKRSN
jgi:DNA-binding beta-propeller fold protein YncE